MDWFLYDVALRHERVNHCKFTKYDKQLSQLSNRLRQTCTEQKKNTSLNKSKQNYK